MLVPFFSTSTRSLERRKGGGGKGGSKSSGKTSSSGSSSSGKTSSSSSGSSSSGSSSSGSSGSSGVGGISAPFTAHSSTHKPTTYRFGSTTRSSSANSAGGGKPSPIPAGQMFAGRIAGGGTRTEIYGSRTYGSGYPGVSGRGVAGRGFPFYFWPVVWPLTVGAGAGIGAAAYLHSTDEYGLPSNDSHLGGPITTAAFSSNSTATTFRIVADNSTVASLIDDISSNCGSHLAGNHSTSPSPFPNDANATDAPKPEQVVQYYRASSISLLLNGYNNTATYAPDGTSESPLPNGVDLTLLDCMNQTIGLSAPLLDAANLSFTPNVGIVLLVWLLLRVGLWV